MAETVHRKLTTVVSADVVGYSRLMDVDEVDTLERLKTYRQAMTGFIESHRGRVVNTGLPPMYVPIAMLVLAR